ncbi:MAG: hypothetical protein IJI14_14345 [Anaerolineaceae bacterium]|nr:hypothetical protein [Anaerolineaceae bacterium]
MSASAVTDTTGPSISDFVISENGQTLTVGDTIHVSAKITDVSGVSRAYLYLAQDNYAGNFRINLSYNGTSGRWEGSRVISDTDINGTYHAVQFDAFDIYNNYSSYYDVDDSYNYRNSVTITGARSDATGPEITDFKIAENGQTLTVGDVIHVSAKITDVSGISRAYVYLATLNYAGDFRIDLAYNSSSDRWEGSRTITETNKNGTYHAVQFDAFDTFNNYSSYYDVDDSYNYLNSVTIEGAIDDVAGPEISDFRIAEDGQTLTIGDVIHVSAKITDMSGISRAYVYLATPNNMSDYRIDLSYNDASGRWEGSYTITEFSKDGTYHAVQFDAFDIYNNYSSYYDMDLNYDYVNSVTIYTGVDPLFPKAVNVVITNIDHKGNRITPAKFMDTVITFKIVVKTQSGEYDNDVRIHPNRFDQSKFDIDLAFPGEMPDLEVGKYEID